MTSESLLNISFWAVSGVNHSIKGNGGPECADSVTPFRRIVDTIFACVLSSIFLYFGYTRVHVPPVPKVERQDRGGKRLLLVLMCLVFGAEIGLKFASRTVIYILNPCHVLTVIQIFLLAAPPTTRLVTILFRIHMHCIYGAILAILFPVLNTRKLPLEPEIYWIQHVLMLIIPFYLLRTGMGGVYTTEPLRDFSWAMMSIGLLLIYHFIILQGLGIVTQVNLNNMLCAAVSDPFKGPNYRIWALAHQTALSLFIGKIYTAISLQVLQTLGTIVWNGEKYVALAASKMQQLCSACSTQSLNGHSEFKKEPHQD